MQRKEHEFWIETWIYIPAALPSWTCCFQRLWDKGTCRGQAAGTRGPSVISSPHQLTSNLSLSKHLQEMTCGPPASTGNVTPPFSTEVQRKGREVVQGFYRAALPPLSWP